METTFENIKKYADFIENRIMTEGTENPEQYEANIEFWINQYNEIENNLAKIIKKLCIKIHPGHEILGANMVYIFIKAIEQRRNGMMKFEEFLELIIQNEWGEVKSLWYGYCIYCFNSKIATKCEDVARKSDKYDYIDRQQNKVYILDFDGLNAYLKGFVGNRIEANINDCINISQKSLDKFNYYSNDFEIFHHDGYYTIVNLAIERENKEKEKEIDEIIDFLFETW